MNPEENLPEVGASGGASPLKVVGMPSLKWIPAWTLLTTAAFPAALISTVPSMFLISAFLNLGVNVGLLSGFNNDLNGLLMAGFFISFSLALAVTQWLMLTGYLPRAWLWLLATGAAVLTGGICGGIVNLFISDAWANPSLERVVFLLPIGCFLGGAHWLVLRRILPKAFWIVPIDVMGTCLLLLAGDTITNLLELILFLIILSLPGMVTGAGIWYLFQQVHLAVKKPDDVEKPAETEARSLPVKWIGLGLVATVSTFFLCIWIYAGSQLALAKRQGVYTSVEEGMIERISQNWGDAEVVSIEDVRASVDQRDGSQPHVWYAIVQVNLDRVPEGWDRTSYSAGSYFIHVKEGWVYLPEGTFPSFIGWVMEVYNMEGVNEWIEESRQELEQALAGD